MYSKDSVFVNTIDETIEAKLKTIKKLKGDIFDWSSQGKVSSVKNQVFTSFYN